MDKDWLEDPTGLRPLDRGDREGGREAPVDGRLLGRRSTGLESMHAPSSMPRAARSPAEVLRRTRRARHVGPPDRQELGLSFGAVQHWLAKHGPQDRARITTRGAMRRSRPRCSASAATHGWTVLRPRRVLVVTTAAPSAAMERVAAYRRRVKEILVEEAGGGAVCAATTLYIGALHFHHLDPTLKRFAVWPRGGSPDPSDYAGRGTEMRATVRKLPRGGRGGAGASGSPADNPG